MAGGPAAERGCSEGVGGSQRCRIDSLPRERKASGSPLKGGLKTAFNLSAFLFPLSRAEHRGSERIKLAGLSERSEFPRDPFDTSTHRIKRGTGVLFCFVFCHGTENEETIQENTPDRSNSSDP